MEVIFMSTATSGYWHTADSTPRNITQYFHAEESKMWFPPHGTSVEGWFLKCLCDKCKPAASKRALSNHKRQRKRLKSPENYLNPSWTGTTSHYQLSSALFHSRIQEVLVRAATARAWKALRRYSSMLSQTTLLSRTLNKTCCES